MCRFLVFDRKLEFQVKSQTLGKNGSLWGGGQNLAKTCTQKFENGHMKNINCFVLPYHKSYTFLPMLVIIGHRIKSSGTLARC